MIMIDLANPPNYDFALRQGFSATTPPYSRLYRRIFDLPLFLITYPESGFFCNGEIGPTHLGSTETKLHGFTSVYTLFEGV